MTFMNDKSHLDLDSVVHIKVTIRSRQCCSLKGHNCDLYEPQEPQKTHPTS